MDPSALEALSQARLDEARVLRDAGHPMGAYYVAGYSVECALKACIAGAIKPDVWPDRGFSESIDTHNLVALMGLAGLRKRLEEDSKSDAELDRRWGVVSKWSEQDRYDRDIDDADAGDSIDAIEHPRSGILRWIQRQPTW